MSQLPRVPENGTGVIPDKTVNVVLLGNPNTGKSTVFNALSGIHQKTGNYPGVTVEKRVGNFEVGDRHVELIDLPGTYSLAPRSPDEMLSVRVLLGSNSGIAEPDVIVCVVDASNLERNLFVTSQLLELQRPTVIALNMIDVADQKGIQIDDVRLSEVLGAKVVPISAKNRTGMDALRESILSASQSEHPEKVHDPFAGDLKQKIDRLEQACPEGSHLKRFAITRMLFDTDGYMIDQMRDEVPESLLKAIRAEQEQLKSEGTFAESESQARYAWIEAQLRNIISHRVQSKKSILDRVDRWITHPILGLVLAAITMVFVFQIVFWAAEPASAAIDWMTGLATAGIDWLFVQFVGAADGALHSLLVDGLIAGVGGVLVFLPQIMLLFLILALLEDSGYLARLAFLTDKYLSRIGLSGITLIPLLSSFACAIPGIMATRVIKDERERLITILIAPLMSCSARLPVYTLLIAAFVPSSKFFGFGLQGLTMLAMYLIGIVVAIFVAWVMKRTFLKTTTSTFVMELPTYKWPSLRNVWLKVYEGGSAFVKDAGTIIVAATVIVWAAAYFPRDLDKITPGLLDREAQLSTAIAQIEPTSAEFGELEDELANVTNAINEQHLRHSYLGRAGRLIEPLVRPLGWDWRIGSAAIASFPAREVIVSTMGVLFGLGSEVDEGSASLMGSIQTATWEGSDKKLFTLPVALSIMVFFALCAQCSSTLAVIKRETRSWYWPIFTFVYMTVLAYVFAFLTYQVAHSLMN